MVGVRKTVVIRWRSIAAKTSPGSNSRMMTLVAADGKSVTITAPAAWVSGATQRWTGGTS